jgi:autoinducer 2 (AI-2) kinase
VRALILAPFSERSLARLRRRGEAVYESWLDTRTLQDPDELGARLATDAFDILVVEADFVFEETFAAAGGLRLVGICRNALNQVDVGAATSHGVAVTHAPGRNTNAVAEMTLALMLALARRIPQAHALVSGAGWRDPALGYRSLHGREVAGSTVGVVGFGQIGRAVAAKCLALGARVLVSDPFVPDRALIRAGMTPVGLSKLASMSDFVSLHVPENEATVRIVDETFIARMRRSSYLINTSGGSVVDPSALATALDEGQIAGAALDVFEGQPLPTSSPLMSCRNLILTPHIAGATDETIERHSRIMTSEIERLLDGKPLQFVVNPEYAVARRD